MQPGTAPVSTTLALALTCSWLMLVVLLILVQLRLDLLPLARLVVSTTLSRQSVVRWYSRVHTILIGALRAPGLVYRACVLLLLVHCVRLFALRWVRATYFARPTLAQISA